jgi:hypothetical protein
MFDLNDVSFLGNLAVLWTPSQITTALWLDANDSASVTLNGSTVSQWSDKSGNGRHATQATAAAQPSYNLTGLNSKPILTFDGSADFLSITEFNDGATVAIVGAGGDVLAPQLSGAAPASFAPAWNAALGRTFYRGVTDIATRSAGFSGSNNFGIGLITLSTSQSAVNIKQDGNTAVTFSQPLVSNDLEINTVGRDYAGATQFCTGSIAEIIVIATVASTSDCEQIEGYLAHKWGLASILPAAHPFRNGPPIV